METSLKVNLIAHTPEPEKVVAAAAKLCYSKSGATDIMNDLDKEKTDKFIDMLMSLGHESPIEHVSFTFAIEGVSRVLTHQLVRHRIASYSQQSQRYVKLEGFEYVIPPAVKNNKEAKDIFEKSMKKDQEDYEKLVKILTDSHVNELMASGMDEKSALKAAEKMAIEDSRYVFPNACETKIVVTMNARSLYNFFNKRCCNRAQWEIREMAELMLLEVKKVAPSLFKYAGPPCIKGECPEGKMSCGKMVEMRKKYGNI